MSKFFRSCLLALAGVIALSLAVELLGRFWGWLLLVAAIGGIIWAVVWFVGWQRDRRW